MVRRMAQRTQGEVVRLVHRGLGVHDFSLAAAHAIGRAVPYDGVCVLTFDPATLIPTGEVVENGLPPAAMARMTEIEIGEPDVNKFAALARAPVPAASLSAATAGRLDRSLRHRELRRSSGFGDELRGAFVDHSGAWGAITLLRETRRPAFSGAETRLLAALSAHLAEGMRRAVMLTELVRGDEESAPGLLLLDDDDSVGSANRAAEAWLDELGAHGRAAHELPQVIRAVAGRARRAGADGLARARVRTPAGRWLLVRGSMIGERAAVLLESARAPDLAPLIADAYGLTERERAVTELVARGLSTDEVASRLYLSPYTVQDHLKAIFDKVGVSTRGELVARLFVPTAPLR